MPRRALHIAAYDISDDRRLRRTLHVLKGYATGGQKSVFECFLTEAERGQLLDEVREVVDESEDRFVLLRLEQRATSGRSASRSSRRTRISSTWAESSWGGLAVQPRNPSYWGGLRVMPPFQVRCGF